MVRSGNRNRPEDIARRVADRFNRQDSSADARRGQARDVFSRETFRLPREQARETARAWFERYPKAAYMTRVESWRVMDDGRIEFTMRRLPSAD
ncbi:MAG: putative DNA polymerase I [Saliniramus fredricksonii]|uniref:Putative DNA polymerase I n=1 Tax=Saliniramus fredricksonii TaxID=1653334 RepID=A0A0N8KEZ8_9HYPH|nr:hypothetical protein [Saliniramus fredricksonii]KPQ12738.1 MAG: putative DNA polymerase I [Saliniramus fredricksonii]SCC82585.1 hypothetical protein GA0071312_3591 [Saliniramus fredricksonii]